MQASVEFTQLTPYNIEGAVFGEATNTKVTVLRLIGGTDDWQMVKGTRETVADKIRALLERNRLQEKEMQQLKARLASAAECRASRSRTP